MSFSFKKMLSKAFGTAFLREPEGRFPGKTSSSQTDRLLSDAVRLAELPSPVPSEEPRAAFVLERLKRLGLLPVVNRSGDILVRIHAHKAVNDAPILLFTDLGSKRWHPTGSLARLDAQNASGAGLSDSLGTAGLLSVAERCLSGGPRYQRDLLLLFTAKSLDDPNISFGPILHSPLDRPFAAIGVRGLSLDRIIHSIGSYHIKLTVAGDAENRRNVAPNKITETLIDTARTLLGITWDAGGKTQMFIRRLEAQTVYALTPQEGSLELEIESDEAPLLEMAMNAVKATAVKIGEQANLKTMPELLSYIPAGNPEKSLALFEILRKLTREQGVNTTEENGADPASFFTGEGLPALSMGIALGLEGADKDVISIASVDKGRIVLERFIMEICAQNGF